MDIVLLSKEGLKKNVISDCLNDLFAIFDVV